MEKNKDEYFLEIFTQLMMTNYPDCIVFDNPKKFHHGKKNMFRLDSKKMVIDVYRKSFYFQLDPKETRKFNQKSSWSIPLLKFGIHLTASTGKTYSYPKLRNYLGDNEDDNLMTATYIFACVNYTIKFFESEIQELNSQKMQ